MSDRCVFCDELSQRLHVVENQHAFAVRDLYPVSQGHTLVVPKQHWDNMFDAPEEQQQALWSLVSEVRQLLLQELSPAGFNIGVNVGSAAGQTVPHAHIHVIPRYIGDSNDPRGGVRWVLPQHAGYWKPKVGHNV